MDIIIITKQFYTSTAYALTSSRYYGNFVLVS